jgi:hypothetical protein
MANIPTIPSKNSGDTFTLSMWNSIRDAVNNGVVTGVQAKVKRTTNQTVIANTLTAVVFDTEVYDTDTMVDLASFNTRITIVTAGKYHVSARVQTDAATGGNIVYTLKLNGSTELARENKVPRGGGSDYGSVWTEYAFAVGDYIEFIVSTGTGSTHFTADGENGTWMAAHRV